MVASIDGAQHSTFCSTGFTRNAVEWSDKAGVALFWLSLSDEHIFPPRLDWQR
jgi:hypothetical protein